MHAKKQTATSLPRFCSERRVLERLPTPTVGRLRGRTHLSLALIHTTCEISRGRKNTSVTPLIETLKKWSEFGFFVADDFFLRHMHVFLLHILGPRRCDSNKRLENAMGSSRSTGDVICFSCVMEYSLVTYDPLFLCV